jgi:hypothetical protein
VTGTGEIEALGALSKDPRLAKLDDYVSALSLFRTFRVERDEVEHSRLLAVLLDPGQHRGAEVMLRVLLEEVLEQGDLEPGLAGRLREIARAEWERVQVRRELFLIDVVVEVSSARGAAVIGIENKIGAGEQREQVARYQDTLLRAFPGRLPVIIFLSPAGRNPLTARDGHSVPVVPVGYEAILRAVEAARQQAEPDSRDGYVLGEVAAHLKEDIVGDPEVTALVRELWRTHRKALGIAVNQRPRLDDMRDRYVDLLKERFGAEIDLYYWHVRGKLREIKMDLPAWHEGGFPFTFMLHANEWGRPRVRALIWHENFAEHEDALREWALRVNDSAGPIIDENFTPVGGWSYWHRVFREEDHPENAVVDEMAFDEGTAVAALEEVSVLAGRLRPHVEGT